MAKQAQHLKPSTETTAVANPKWEYGQMFTFRLRRVAQPKQFAGLWNLEMLDENGKTIKVISDADAMNFCLDNLMGELEAEGF